MLVFCMTLRRQPYEEQRRICIRDAVKRGRLQEFRLYGRIKILQQTSSQPCGYCRCLDDSNNSKLDHVCQIIIYLDLKNNTDFHPPLWL